MSPCREGTNPNNKRRAGNDRAYHRDCFRQRQQEDCCDSVVRMPPDKVDDPGKIRRHRLSSCEQADNGTANRTFPLRDFTPQESDRMQPAAEDGRR